MRICILTDEEIEDFNPEPFMEGFDWEMVTMTDPVIDVFAFLWMHVRSLIFILTFAKVMKRVKMRSRPITECDVVRALEELHLPFTGADSKFFDPTREEMQAAADANGVGFARGYHVKSVEEAESLVKNLRYPIMVKHHRSYGSTGMIRESKVESAEQLREQVARICAEFGAARMEEFIGGQRVQRICR